MRKIPPIAMHSTPYEWGRYIGELARASATDRPSFYSYEDALAEIERGFLDVLRQTVAGGPRPAR
jgi:hypothetical protein